MGCVIPKGKNWDNPSLLPVLHTVDLGTEGYWGWWKAFNGAFCSFRLHNFIRRIIFSKFYLNWTPQNLIEGEVEICTYFCTVHCSDTLTDSEELCLWEEYSPLNLPLPLVSACIIRRAENLLSCFLPHKIYRNQPCSASRTLHLPVDMALSISWVLLLKSSGLWCESILKQFSLCCFSVPLFVRIQISPRNCTKNPPPLFWRFLSKV